MIHLIGEHKDANGLTERWWGDDETNVVVVERVQDVESVIEHVAAVNVEGHPMHDGVGAALGEIPLVPAEMYCAKRGIDVTKFLYTNEYPDELERFWKEFPKFAYKSAKRLHAVA